MKPGGTLNTRVVQNDLNEIQSGQMYAPQLLALPLTVGFMLGVDGPSVSAATNSYGARPDLMTATGGNPIIGNLTPASKGTQVPITPTRIQLPQPCNCIQLLWHALDLDGNYRCSYPLNAVGNSSNKLWPLTDTSPASVTQHWAFGWMRANGLGPWLPMSLLPSTDWFGGCMMAFPFGGFSSLTGPLSFVDWIGYYDGGGYTAIGPQGNNAFIMALASANLSLSSNRSTMGQISNYAVPNGSGPEPNAANTDTTKNQDILVKANGR